VLAQYSVQTVEFDRSKAGRRDGPLVAAVDPRTHTTDCFRPAFVEAQPTFLSQAD
jgi:hypothetical protein